MVMVNLLLVNPMNSFTMMVVWAGAGFVGGIMAGTKKGAFVVGLTIWLACLGILALCVFLLIEGGLAIGALVIPPGTSLVDLLSIPLVQGAIDQILPLISGIFGGGGAFDMSSIVTIIMPLIIWFITPVVIVIVAGILGAVVRPKEDF